MAAAAAADVLDKEDLLGEILLRVAFPTSLVRAALVCKLWLRLVSAPAFLRRFCDLHPPHLLGFYVVTHKKAPRFVPMPHPPELASVFLRASFDLLDTGGSCDRIDLDISWNGSLLVSLVWWFYNGAVATCKKSVRHPLCPTSCVSFLPAVPKHGCKDGFTYYRCEILPKGGCDGQPYFCLMVGCKEQQTILDVYVLEENIWAAYPSAVTETPRIEQLLLPSSLILDGVIYNIASVGSTCNFVSLDLSSSSLSLVNLPEEVDVPRIDLSIENDSEVHLIHVKGSQLRIWLYMVGNNARRANWLLVNTICLREICANHMIPTSVLEDVGDSKLVVYAVGGNSGLFFLEKDEILYVFNIKMKTAKKVFEVTQEDKLILDVKPFMMVWPPKFPLMKLGSSDPKNDIAAR